MYLTNAILYYIWFVFWLNNDIFNLINKIKNYSKKLFA